MAAMFNLADQELAAFAAGHHSVFTKKDAWDAGLSHGQIDRRVADVWVHVHDGVYRMPGVKPTWKGFLLAACRAATDPSAISHRSAGGIYEFPGGSTELIELTCARWLRPRRSGVIVHESSRIDERDIQELDGLPIMRPERVVLELAGLRPSPRYIEAVIHAARRKRLITYESTLEVFNRHARRGVRGVQALRSALEQWDPAQRPTDSDMETWLLQMLRDRGCPEATTQFEVLDRHGLFVARVDAALPEWRIAIEYDSKQEHSDEFQIEHDARRRNRIIAAGYSPLVARHRDLRTGGHELYAEIKETQLNQRRFGTPQVP
jgi:very-short-patch-repair endonuclease